MIELGVKESFSNWKATLIRSVQMAIVGFIIGYFWFTTTGDPKYMVYLLMAELIAFNRPRVAKEFSLMIRTAQIDLWMTRPRSLFYKFFGIFFGRSLVGLLISSIIVLPIAFFYYPPHLLYFPLFLMAFLVNYSISAIIGYMSFWVGDSRPYEFIVDKINFFFSGTLIPFEFLPNWLALIAKSLPFQLVGYFPAKAMVGDFMPSLFLSGILWTVGLVAAALIIEKYGVKKYEVVGG